MTVKEFVQLSDREKDALLGLYMHVQFGDDALEAIDHLKECGDCCAKYALQFEHFMLNTVADVQFIKLDKSAPQPDIGQFN